LGLVDVLRTVALRGTPTFAELDATLLLDDPGDIALDCLDACVDDGLLSFRWRGGDPDLGRFRLTPRGRRLLLASSLGAQAA
jgi:hypothetical protein